MRIERGTVIADRYVVSAIEKPWLADAPDAGVVCLALDAILDAPVILYLADEEVAGDLKDAGRRLSLVNDPRIPTVLDVGSSTVDDAPIVYLVAERTAATSLAEILASGPIGPVEARAIAGEVSEVLVHAGRRGLHHRCLGPESIGIMADGDVVVHGIAIDAALSELALGLEVQTDATALREDALAIIDILYACLTGQWPKPEARAGLPAAPRKNRRVVAVEELRRDIPEDLIAFITGVTSHTDPGPRSPGEIIRYLREWKRDSLSDLEGSPLPDEALFTRGDDTAPEATPTTAGSAPAADGEEPARTAEAARAGSAPAEAASAATATSTSAGAGVAGAKPTANTVAPSTGSTGMGATGARPTTAPPARPQAPEAPAPRQATPDQIQAALARIGMSRPGASGFSAGRTDGVATKLDDRLQMREASVFPLTGQDLEGVDTKEWTPEQTYSDYENLAAAEYDPDTTAPILDRDALWGRSEDVSTQQMPVIPDLSETDDAGSGAATDEIDADEDAATVPMRTGAAGASGEPEDGTADGGADDAAASSDDEQDNAWFLGGVFTTHEEQIRRQREVFDRERALEQRRAAAARRAVEEAEARTARQRAASQREAARQADEQTEKDVDAAAATPAGVSAAGAAGATASTVPAQTSAERTAEPASAAATTSGPGTGAAAGAAASGPSARVRRRRTVVGLLLALVVSMAIVLVTTLTGRDGDEQAAPAPEPTEQETQEPTLKEPEEDAPAPVIEGIEAIDPEGDDEENSDAAELVMPGVSGGWRSERYNSPEFGGLKSGLGLRIDLEEESLVSGIDLLAPEGSAVLEIRVGDSEDVEDAETLETITLDGDTSLDFDEPATGKHVFLWFTQASPEGGGYRAMVHEAELR